MYLSGGLFTFLNVGLLLFRRIVRGNAKEVFVSTAVPMIEDEDLRYVMVLNRKLQLIHKGVPPLFLMDHAQTCAGQNQLIVFPAQAQRVHRIQDSMRVGRIHAREREDGS